MFASPLAPVTSAVHTIAPSPIVTHREPSGSKTHLRRHGPRRATYWLAQAQGRVTHAESVSSGVEDYYLAGPETVGQWTGGGLDALELGGEVTEEALTGCWTARTHAPANRCRGRRAGRQRSTGST